MSVTDHKAGAERLIDSDDVHGSLNGRRDSSTMLAEAQVHATLALAEQQRIANLIAFVASVQRGVTDTLPSETVMRRAQSAGEQIVKGLGLE